MQDKNWQQVELVYKPAVRALCKQRYPGHPHGCPNWGKRATCPPSAPLLPHHFDLAKPTFVIWNAFDLAVHAERMRMKHPEWSDRQVYCCLYWQPKARKQLRDVIRRFHVTKWIRKGRVVIDDSVPSLVVNHCPEALGVDVTATMQAVGIELEWPPRQAAYQVAIAGELR